MKELENIQNYIDKGLVSVQKHPDFPYIEIYNYTEVCAFSSAWDDITMATRGLIVDTKSGKILARPFKKFFNVGEHEQRGFITPSEKPNIYEKYDGSLGILYFLEGKPYIATRGSFSSDQAKWANEWLYQQKELLEHLSKEINKGVTHLFEIIYPENRIVIDYQGKKGLVWIGSVDIETGRTIMEKPDFIIDFVESYKETKTERENREGYVLHYPNADVHLKLKHEEYVRLHKIMTGLSEIGIWEYMCEHGSNVKVTDIAENIPDELYNWIQDVINRLGREFLDIERTVSKCVDAVMKIDSRKDQAIFLKDNCKYVGIAFSMLDNKNYKDAIWRIIRPSGKITMNV